MSGEESTTRKLEKRHRHLRAGHGRWARRPWQMPAAAWRDTLWRALLSSRGDRIGLVAAGVAFYLLLSIVPALAAMLTLYSIYFDVSDVYDQFDAVRGIVPEGVLEVLREEMTRLAGKPQIGGFGVVVSVVLSLWGASKSHQALSIALDVAYGERSSRNLITARLRALALAAITAFTGVLALGLLVIGPQIALALGWDSAPLLRYLRWPFLALAFWGWLMITYRFSPSRRPPRWPWVTCGSLLATLLWLASSALLSWYARELVDLGKTYGSLAGIVLLLLWLYAFGFCLLLGAELDSEIEHQTVIDTTIGPDRPLGKRGAYVADTIGRAKTDKDSWFSNP